MDVTCGLVSSITVHIENPFIQEPINAGVHRHFYLGSLAFSELECLIIFICLVGFLFCSSLPVHWAF